MTEPSYRTGDTVSWYHGHAYLKVVTIKKIEANRVLLQGMSATYWLKRTTLEKNLGKADPRASSMACTATYAH